VVAGGYDLGIAFDGDADRCLAVDEKGHIVDGDRLIAIISAGMKEAGTLKNDTAVVTVMSNLGFHTYMKEHGINTVCTAVGDRYVLEEMLKSGYNIGGEQSGHIIFLDHATTGDGQLTAVKLISLLTHSERPLSSYNEEFTDYPQLLVNVKISADKKGLWNKNEAILASIKEAEDALGENGRVLVRESGTEPLVRVMIEGRDAELVDKYTNRIADTVKKEFT
jgi:phosphoglucosamine mutase